MLVVIVSSEGETLWTGSWDFGSLPSKGDEIYLVEGYTRSVLRVIYDVTRIKVTIIVK